MSTARFNTWQNTDGTENFKCRAWVNFNGTGTVAIRASGNVSSVSDNGNGDYTVNFTTAMPDANYAPVFGGDPGASTGDKGPYVQTQTASTLRIYSYNTSGTLTDRLICSVAIFR